VFEFSELYTLSFVSKFFELCTPPFIGRTLNIILKHFAMQVITLLIEEYFGNKIYVRQKLFVSMHEDLT